MAAINIHGYSDKRQRAILAAASVFAEMGYHGSTTQDIAKKMGIKQGSLYYYFKSKEDALGEVCLFGIRDYVARMETIASSDQDLEAKLFAIVTSHLSSYREKNEALKVHNDERFYLPKEKRTLLRRLGSGYRQRLEDVLADGVKAGKLRDSLDCHFAAQTVIGLCNAWGNLIVRNHDISVIDTAQKCCDLLLNGFRERRREKRIPA